MVRESNRARSVRADGRSRITWPVRPRDSRACPSIVTRTPPALPRVRRKPPRASKRRVSPLRTNPSRSVPPDASSLVHESASNSSRRETSRSSGADGGAAGGFRLLDGGRGLARGGDVLQLDPGRARRRLVGPRGRPALGPRDQPEQQQDRGHASDDRSRGGAAPPPEPRPRPRDGRRISRRRFRQVGQVRADFFLRLDPDVDRVRADEPASERGSGKPGDVTVFEGLQQPDGDLRRRRDFLERDLPHEPFPAKLFTETENGPVIHCDSPRVVTKTKC